MSLAVKTETLRYDRPVMLAGPADMDFELLNELLGRGFPLIAADGGANRLMEMGLCLEAIIGDMDSLDGSIELDKKIKQVRLAEQDSTDFEKCLYSVKAPLFLAFGFTGKRFDHTLATLHAMVKYRDRKNVLLMGGEDISFVHSGIFEFPTVPGQTVSVFPLCPIRFSQSEGLEYSLAGMDLEMGLEVGTSNRANGAKVRIVPARSFKDTPYLISLPGTAFEHLVV